MNEHRGCTRRRGGRAHELPIHERRPRGSVPGSGPRSLADRGCLRAAVLAALTSLVARGALANPQDGRIVAGSAAIGESGKRLDVVQTSERAIIDWRSFDIARGEGTHFAQPSTDSVTLNRVTGGDLSRIDGTLSANGRLFLVNPNGALFGDGAQVTVGGLVATTADLRNDAFMAGRYDFTDPSGRAGAAIVNEGVITVGDGGSVVLAAPVVRNAGVITARLGQIQLAGTNTFTLDFDGDGWLSFAVGEEVTHVASATEALVDNSGTLQADGGIVSLTANAAEAVIDRVISMEGVVQARTVGIEDGTIVLSGGEHGIVNVSGTLDAVGAGAKEHGGHIAVLGDKVGLFDGARLNANGLAGGGEVLVGGNFQGNGPEQNASRTYVGADARIDANASVSGDGGRVIVWADEGTQYYGEINARGGIAGGDGGFVEVSGKARLDFQGMVDASADSRDGGHLLLDPDSITVCDNEDACDPGIPIDPTDPVLDFGGLDNSEVGRPRLLHHRRNRRGVGREYRSAGCIQHRRGRRSRAPTGAGTVPHDGGWHDRDLRSYYDARCRCHPDVDRTND